ncbi:hypothetical protein QVD17_24747 [Tagetes erecta]|uniref:Uncharacterized protein n=1 Tax=Tagetes erecta TaxID=13708 RepID=A0AAD8KFD0_TARER|nr:hypothetical protein QVD17_24747 [Tagetes erecta]
MYSSRQILLSCLPSSSPAQQLSPAEASARPPPDKHSTMSKIVTTHPTPTPNATIIASTVVSSPCTLPFAFRISTTTPGLSPSNSETPFLPAGQSPTLSNNIQQTTQGQYLPTMQDFMTMQQQEFQMYENLIREAQLAALRTRLLLGKTTFSTTGSNLSYRSFQSLVIMQNST